MNNDELAGTDWQVRSQDFDAPELPELPPSAFSVISKGALQREIARATAAVERKFLAALMLHCAGNISAAAKASGIHRSHLQRMLSRCRA